MNRLETAEFLSLIEAFGDILIFKKSIFKYLKFSAMIKYKGYSPTPC